MHSSRFFRIKLIARLILKREISGSHTISDQSLLLSTNVLNDSVLIVDYGEYFNLTVYFDLWTKIEVRGIVECHPLAEMQISLSQGARLIYAPAAYRCSNHKCSWTNRFAV